MKQLPDWCEQYLRCPDHGSGLVSMADSVSSCYQTAPGYLIGSIRRAITVFSAVRLVEWECGCRKDISSKPVAEIDHCNLVFRRYEKEDDQC